MMSVAVKPVRYLLLAVGLLLCAFPARAEESVCLQCHGGQEGRLGAPVAEWRTSIHAENGISCHDCHGGDPTDFAMAMNPERGFVGVPAYGQVPDFCGRCHIGVKDDYLASGHGQALDGGGPQCVVCHGNHGVKQASLELINPQDCSRCHDFGRAEEIRTAMGETDRMIAGLQLDLQGLGKLGIAVKELEGESFALRNDFHRIFHSVEVEKVRRQTAEFQQRGSELRGKIEEIHAELANRKLIGGLVAGLLFLTSLICFLIRKTYHDEEQAGRE